MSTSSTVRTVKDWEHPRAGPETPTSLPLLATISVLFSCQKPRNCSPHCHPGKMLRRTESGLGSHSTTQLPLTPSFREVKPSEPWKDMSLGFPSMCSETQSSEILQYKKREIFFIWSMPLSPAPFPIHHSGFTPPSAAPLPPSSPGRLTQCYVDNVEGEDVDGEEGEREDEEVEVAVVPLPHAVAHPGTVMVEALWGSHNEDQHCPGMALPASRSLLLCSQLQKSPRLTNCQVPPSAQSGPHILASFHEVRKSKAVS